jgi:hypothetical protein
MKISDDDLRRIYQEYLKSNSPSSRENCPDPKTILNSLRSTKFSRKKAKIINHVSICFHCAKEFEFLLDTLRQESDFNKKLAKFAPPSNENSESAHFRKLKILVPAASIVFFVTIFLGYFAFKYINSRELRSPITTCLELENPIDSTIELHNQIFEWTQIPAISHYQIEIFDYSLSPIWVSKEIFSNSYKAPPLLINMLSSSDTYFWMVTAIYSDGRSIESRLGKFTIKK